MTFEELISALGERIGVALAAEDGSCVINVDDMVVTLMSLPDSDRLAVHGEIGDRPPRGTGAAALGHARGEPPLRRDCGSYDLARQ